MSVSEKKSGRLLLLLLSVFLSLALAEAAARLIFPHQKRTLPKILVHEPSPNFKLLYKPSPGTVNRSYGVENAINSHGFRDREYDLAKKPGYKRILFLGDSVVYGIGIKIEDTIPEQLEKIFEEKGEKVEVLNFGVSGYETEQEVEFFKETGRQFQPDLVILGYTLNDSIYASMELDFFNDKLAYHIKVPRRELRKRILGALFKYSRLLQVLDERFRLQERFSFLRSYRNSRIWYYVHDRNVAVKDEDTSYYQQTKIAIVQEARRRGTSDANLKSKLGFVGIGNNDFYSSHWKVSYAAMKDLASMSKTHGFKVSAVIFPYMLDPEHYALAPMHNFLKEKFSKLNFQVIDPSEKVFNTAKSEMLVNDPIHFNAKGGRIIAEEIYEQLKISGRV